LSTYSLGSLAIPANSQQAVANITLPDAQVQGGTAQEAQQNTQLLCRNPDLSTTYYTIDSTRYRLDGKPYVLAVWP
jgi:hypothetical protein